MLLCPEHNQTSPNNTSLSVTAPSLEVTFTSWGPPAGMAGRLSFHWSWLTLVVTSAWPVTRTLTVSPSVSAVPHSTACCGARCRTMWSPKNVDNCRAHSPVMVEGVGIDACYSDGMTAAAINITMVVTRSEGIGTPPPHTHTHIHTLPSAVKASASMSAIVMVCLQ